MLVETKLRKIGSSLGIILPEEALQAMNVDEGSLLYLTESTEGAIRITTARPEFSTLMAIAENGMSKYCDSLRKLAK